VHSQAQPGRGQGCTAWGTAVDGGRGATGTAGAGRQRGGVARAVESEEEVDGPGGNSADTCWQRLLAGAKSGVGTRGGQARTGRKGLSGGVGCMPGRAWNGDGAAKREQRGEVGAGSVSMGAGPGTAGAGARSVVAGVEFSGSGSVSMGTRAPGSSAAGTGAEAARRP
jgi:hypothetical protein